MATAHKGKEITYQQAMDFPDERSGTRSKAKRIAQGGDFLKVITPVNGLPEDITKGCLETL